MILSASEISKSYNEVPVLRNASFHIEEHDRAAIVGPNGCGKTTLIRILVGQLSADEGSVAIARDTTVGYLEQDVSTRFNGTIMEVLMSTRQDILDIEDQINRMNSEADTLSGEALDKHIEALTSKLEEMGVELEQGSDYVRVFGREDLKPAWERTDKIDALKAAVGK